MNPVRRRDSRNRRRKFGANVTVVEPANLYGCEIGDETFIGPFVEIQRGVTSATLPNSVTRFYLRAGYYRGRLFHFPWRDVH